MKNITLRRLTIVSTIVYSVVSALFFLINYFSSNILLSILITLPVSIAVFAYVIHFLLKSYIKTKVRPIYKTIHDFNTNDESRENLPNNEPLKKVSQEVANWMHGKTKEIQQLKQMERYRKEFLGNVSHELKTPIFNIQGYILTLLEGGIEDENINMLYLNRTEKSIDRMISIIEDLEAISKLESGELEIYKEKFNLFDLVDEVFDMHDIRSKEHNVKLKLNKSGDKHLFVNADKQRIFQVISNLVMNSINYGKVGGETVINFYDMDNQYLIEVKDNGIGIKDADLPRVFERFYRADKSRSRQQGGTGLGLAIVKHIMEAHNQTINVKSTLGKGTSFTITLDKG